MLCRPGSGVDPRSDLGTLIVSPTTCYSGNLFVDPGQWESPCRNNPNDELNTSSQYAARGFVVLTNSTAFNNGRIYFTTSISSADPKPIPIAQDE